MPNPTNVGRRSNALPLAALILLTLAFLAPTFQPLLNGHPGQVLFA